MTGQSFHTYAFSSVLEIQGPTGDVEVDQMAKRVIQEELERLQRNMERREARERAKGVLPSPSVANSPRAADAENGDATALVGSGKKGRAKKNNEGTGRRCANCGQVGHIKTNKKCADSSVSFTSFASPDTPNLASDDFYCEHCPLGKGATGFSTSGVAELGGSGSGNGRGRGNTGRKTAMSEEARRARKRELNRERRRKKKVALASAETVTAPAPALLNPWLNAPSL